MITIYKNSETGLVALQEPVQGTWINVIDPTAEEVICLQNLGISSDYITYALDLDELSHTERENGEIFILLRIPFFAGVNADVPYTTLPLGIILKEHYVVTVCKRDNDILHELASGKLKGISVTKRLRFVLRLLLATANKYLVYLRQINKEVDALEDQLQQSTRNREVLELLKYQKSLTFFTTALKSNELMMERLQRSQLFRAYPEDEDLLEDVLTENQQAIEMTNIAGNILSQMMDAFASIISNNLNVVMKFLASITIVLSLPTMIASFFGMNVNLPFASQVYAFAGVIVLSLVTAVSVAYLFSRRGWL